jgi:hypothetical protein
MLTSFFSTTKNSQRLVLLALLLSPVFFINQSIATSIWALLGFFLTALLLEFLSVRFGALSRTNGLYWLLAGACFYGATWTHYNFQLWLETALLASYLGGLLNLSANGSSRDAVFVTSFLSMAVMYVIPYGWLLLLLVPAAMLQWQERDLRKWWLMLVGMGSFTFLFWTFAEVFPWHNITWAPAPRSQADWQTMLILLGAGLLLMALRFGLWPNKWAPTDNRRVRTMLWALGAFGVLALVFDPNATHLWVWVAFPFWLWIPVVLQNISKKWLADLALLLLLVSIWLAPPLF